MQTAKQMILSQKGVDSPQFSKNQPKAIHDLEKSDNLVPGNDKYGNR
jgi:hypothetical protein